jgi:hypothetical protein
MRTSPPGHPFTSTELPSLGLTHNDIDTMVIAGKVRRVFRGGYVPSDIDDTIEVRAKLAARLLPSGHVMSGRTAAWLYGVDTYAWSEGEDVPAIDACVLPGNDPTDQRGTSGHTRDLSPKDVTEIDGVAVTTQLRTAMDLGCLLKPREAIATLDAFARAHGITADLLMHELPRFRRRRGVRQLRDLAPLVDPRIESARESWVRYDIHVAGLPVPEPQYWVSVEGVPTYRLDFAYPRRRVAVEYDGYDTHERTPEQIEHDRQRRAWLRANGWTVIVIRRGDFSGGRDMRWLRELERALESPYTPLRKLERGWPPRG